VARRRHGLKVEDEGLLKDFIVIFVFLGMLYTVRCCFFMPESYSQKKKTIQREAIQAKHERATLWSIGHSVLNQQDNQLDRVRER
jgi:hypothetical protein